MTHPHDGGGGLAGLSSTGSTSSGGLAERFKQNPLGVIGTALQSFIEGSEGRPISAVGREGDRSKREFERRRLAVLESGEVRAKKREDRADTKALQDAKIQEIEVFARGLKLPPSARKQFAEGLIEKGLEPMGKLLLDTLNTPDAEARLNAAFDALSDMPKTAQEALIAAAVASDDPNGFIFKALEQERKRNDAKNKRGKLRPAQKADGTVIFATDDEIRRFGFKPVQKGTKVTVTPGEFGPQTTVETGVPVGGGAETVPALAPGLSGDDSLFFSTGLSVLEDLNILESKDLSAGGPAGFPEGLFSDTLGRFIGTSDKANRFLASQDRIAGAAVKLFPERLSDEDREALTEIFPKITNTEDLNEVKVGQGRTFVKNLLRDRIAALKFTKTRIPEQLAQQLKDAGIDPKDISPKAIEDSFDTRVREMVKGSTTDELLSAAQKATDPAFLRAIKAELQKRLKQ